MPEFKSFYKEVTERKFNTWCRYGKRLDTYGCGCLHNCDYCYARHLLAFRGNWHPYDPATASIKAVREKVIELEAGTVVKLGGMTDCFQPIERVHEVTLETIRALNAAKVHYLIVTKSAAVVFPQYMDEYDPELVHFQITVTSTDDWRGNRYETASPMSLRIWAAETLQAHGFDVSLRLSPYIPEFVDTRVINDAKVEKILIEFLKVNPFVRRTFAIDYEPYSLEWGGHSHLQLERKVELADRLTEFEERSVGEYVRSHYLHFRDNYNHNPFDCCNLRGIEYDDYPEIGAEPDQDPEQLCLFGEN